LLLNTDFDVIWHHHAYCRIFKDCDVITTEAFGKVISDQMRCMFCHQSNFSNLKFLCNPIKPYAKIKVHSGLQVCKQRYISACNFLLDK
jgi:hypothetical protein